MQYHNTFGQQQPQQQQQQQQFQSRNYIPSPVAEFPPPRNNNNYSPPQQRRSSPLRSFSQQPQSGYYHSPDPTAAASGDDIRSGSEGLANLAASFDALHPMYRAMRDLEAGKDRELQLAREQLFAKDSEIQKLRQRVKQLEQEARLGMFAHHHNTENLLSSPAPGLNNSNTYTHGSLMSSPRNQLHLQQPTPSPSKAKQQQKHQYATVISDSERQELEEMLSRSIAGLADAERALVSERSRFLVVDPTAISMERWRAAVSRLADLHDEVAHRRFGACLAAARLSGQLPDDLGQVAATQFLRGALSPVMLTHMANCFKKATAEEAEALLSDPWKRAERQLAEEPDMLLHHINAVIERLVIDPGDEFVA